MLLGALIAGTIAGVAAGGLAVFGFGASVWLGLIVWWLVGTVAMLAPLLLAAVNDGGTRVRPGLATV